MSTASYIINFDELSQLIENYLKDGINVDIGDVTVDTDGIEKLLKDISNKIEGVDYNDLIRALNALGAKLDGLSGNLGITGIQKIYGSSADIAGLQGKCIIEFKVPKTGKITDITYSLSAWNLQDTWDLQVDEETLFNGVRTKEYGENKHFNVFYPVRAGQVIKFVYNNNSEASKTLWVDFAILEGGNYSPPISGHIDNNNNDDMVATKAYKLLAIGESIYTLPGTKNLTGCVHDVDNIINLFSQHKQKIKLYSGKNKTKEEAINLIKGCFNNALNKDVSYLFWSGHGTIYQDDYAMVCKDNIITAAELKEILDTVKGTKVIFLDTCHSGKIIDKDFAMDLALLENKLRDLNKNNTFIEESLIKKEQRAVAKSLKGLNTDTYKVLTACNTQEQSKDLSAGYNGNPNPSGAFTWALTQSIRNKKADKDKNGVVTLEELYQAVLHYWEEFNVQHPQLAVTQTTTVYPENDTTAIYEYK